MITAQTLSLISGDTWARSWILTDPTGQPVNLTGATARLHVRDKTNTTVIRSTTENGHIAIVGIEGRVDLTVPESATALPVGSYRFQLKITFSDGTATTIYQGQLNITECLTRD